MGWSEITSRKKFPLCLACASRFLSSQQKSWYTKKNIKLVSMAQAPRTSRASLVKGSSKSVANTEAQQALIAHWQGIVKSLGNFLNTLKVNHVSKWTTLFNRFLRIKMIINNYNNIDLTMHSFLTRYLRSWSEKSSRKYSPSSMSNYSTGKTRHICFHTPHRKGIYLFLLLCSLLLRRECCSFSNGEYVKAGLAELEHWCYKATDEVPKNCNTNSW